MRTKDASLLSQSLALALALNRVGFYHGVCSFIEWIQHARIEFEFEFDVSSFLTIKYALFLFLFLFQFQLERAFAKN